MSSCMKQSIDAFYSTRYYNGGNSIELSKNGVFEYDEWNDYGWGTKGKGTYSIENKKLNLLFGDYDSINVSIIQDTNRIIISAYHDFEFSHNCYKLYSNSNSNNCKYLSNDKTTIISKHEYNRVPLIDSVQMKIYISQENLGIDSFQYNIAENRGKEYTKSVLYSDIQHRVKPNTTWQLKINKRKIKIEGSFTKELFRMKNGL